MNDDLRFYIGILRRRLLPFLAVSAAVAALATVIIFAIPPLYRSEATILVESQQIPDELLKTTVTGLAEQRLQVTRQKITSRDALLEIADKFGLFAEERKEMSTTSLITLMRKRITIEPFDVKLNSGNSQNALLTVAFKVGFDYERAETAAKVANDLVTKILDLNSTIRITQARETRQFFEREQQRLSQELAKLEATISKFELENREALPERVPFQMAALERLEDNRKEIDRDLNVIKESIRQIETEISIRRRSGGTSSAGSDSGRPTSLEDQLRQLKSELAVQGAVYKASHPEILRLKQAIKNIEAQLSGENSENADAGSETSDADKSKMDIDLRVLTEKKEAAGRQLELYESQKTKIEDSIRGLTKLLSNAPEVQNQSAQLKRQRDGIQKEIDDVGAKLSSARLSERMEVEQQAERFQVIENPITPQEPVWPQIPKLLAMGAGVAGVSGAAVVGLLELINRSIRTSSDVMRAVNRYPMVVIPYIMTKEENRRRLRKILMLIAGLIMTALLVIAAVHFLFMHLDELYYKLLNRMGV